MSGSRTAFGIWPLLLLAGALYLYSKTTTGTQAGSNGVIPPGLPTGPYQVNQLYRDPSGQLWVLTAAGWVTTQG